MAHVLVVDDDTHVRAALRAVLDENGYTVSEAETTGVAKDMLSDEAHAVSAILLDIWLPEEGGVAFLRELRSNGSDLPIVMMSGGGPGRSLEDAIALADASGADAVLIKPFQNKELLDALDGALN
ncbi:response regulator [Litoreibacter roseus]|uniref:Response regulatory domain-containing protein n=1 Tax=Litoreibacter roseus TaxID=2601869 RepID=A0A6N6JEC8_9RHOB|nr:response regulator [Litoreibacter roseus]GFE64180.1 hypothetical protein KIN_12540 [Litoreibacter roseus]